MFLICSCQSTRLEKVKPIFCRTNWCNVIRLHKTRHEHYTMTRVSNRRKVFSGFITFPSGRSLPPPLLSLPVISLTAQEILYDGRNLATISWFTGGGFSLQRSLLFITATVLTGSHWEAMLSLIISAAGWKMYHFSVARPPPGVGLTETRNLYW